ncbi:MAG: VCBS repeat-containing protein [Acidobacteria bacterium]|nr:VCBS repeat-containing protein [Acidobacteriota bacterium]
MEKDSTMRKVGPGFTLATLLLAACGGGPGGETVPVIPGVDPEQVLTWNNLGVAHLERYRYGQAEEEFLRVVESAPEWPAGHVNLGIARMSLGRSDEAMAGFDRALALDPANPHAAYGKGLVHRNRGESEAAIAAFGRLVEAGIEDTDLYYNLGMLHFRERRSEEAARFLEKAIALDPYNASAQFKLASVLQDLGRAEEADRRMQEFQRITDGDMGKTAGQQYAEQGRYAEAITAYGAAGVERAGPPADGVRFRDVASEAGIGFRHGGPGAFAGAPKAEGEETALRRLGSGAAWADIDGDGDPDLFLPNLGGPHALYRNLGGTFEEIAAAAGVAGSGDGIAAYFGDYDNDHDPDLFVASLGLDRLYANRGDGTFEDVTARAGIDSGGASLGAAWADVDHDGDLDLFVTARGSGGNRLYRNNGNGTFTERAGELGLSGTGRGVGVLFTDFDNDRDIDLLSWSDGAPPELFSNLREDRFLDLAREAGLPAGGRPLGAVVADWDKDGWMDLALTGHGGAAILRNEAGRRFVPDEAAADALAVTAEWAASTGLQAGDFDNDGFLDLVLVGEDRRGGGTGLFLRNLGRDGWEDRTAVSGIGTLVPAAPRGLALADYDRDGDADILITSNGGAPALLRNEGGERNSWLEITTRGVNSNRPGVGTKVEVQAGGLWQKQEVSGGSGYLSQNDPRLRFGLGGRARADFVRLLWPGGVLQSEMEKAAGEPVVVEELDRKGSSCPTLFAWSGERFDFVTDLLGVGGIGFLLRPWTYVRPDPTEYVRLEPGSLRPREGRYRLALVGQLEEAIYLDSVRLVAVDHPEGTEVYPDERFALGPERPSDRIHRARERFRPYAARDDRGRDLLDRLLRVDRRYADGFGLLPFAGYAEPHAVDLWFRGLPPGRRWVLYLHGWVDYEYSSSTLAAHQAGVELIPPALQVLDGRGSVIREYPAFGFPAGMPKMMTFPIPDPLPAPEARLRIQTNMRIYWDQVFLAPAEEGIPVAITRIEPAEARLDAVGFPREFSPDGSRPLLYDYHLPGLGFPWKRMAGSYTRFGDVSDLVREADDRFVIMGPGEEVGMGFDPERLPLLRAGWLRTFLFFADGFCKDMDPNTAHPDTVEPLPFHAMTAYPYPSGESYPDTPDHREYRKAYNTRRIEGF